MLQSFNVDSNGILISIDNCPEEFIFQADVVYTQSTSNNKTPYENCKNIITKISADLNSKLTTIQAYSFFQFTNLEEVELTNCKYLIYIGNRAFSGCSKLSCLKLPSSVKVVENAAFSVCNLSFTFTIKQDLSYITGESFLRTNTSFEVESSQYYSEYKNNIYNYSYSELVIVSHSTKELYIHEKTTKIGNCAFSCSSVEAVHIPEQITSFGSYAFHRAEYLKELVINAAFTSFSYNSFFELPNLESIWFPDSFIDIAANTLRNCPKLRTVRVSDQLNSAAKNSFVRCTNVRYVYNVDNNKRAKLWDSGIPHRALIDNWSPCHQKYSTKLNFVSSLFIFGINN